MKLAKRTLYKDLIDRMDAAVTSGHNLEASWYAYAILEDRMLSMLASSGGIPTTKKGKPISMMGPKLKELERRADSGNSLLKAVFDRRAITAWKDRRDDLMHSMANASKPLADIDKEAALLAESAAELVRSVCAGAMRLKKHAAKGR